MSDNENGLLQSGGGGAAQSSSYKARNIPLPANIKLTGNMKSNWQTFKQVWDSYELLTGLKNEPHKYRVATFITCIGVEALERHNGLPFKSEEERQNMDVILKLWEEHCVGLTNVIYERYVFNKAVQHEGECIEAFVVHLRKLASTCQYGTLHDELIRDRIVCGLLDESIRGC